MPPFIKEGNISPITNDRDFSEANICNVINDVREQYQAKKLHMKLNIKDISAMKQTEE